MGLDTYASHSPDGDGLTPEDMAVFDALDLRLCEWIGDGSFRGKVYDELVLEVAGVSLYQEWIPWEDVVLMAEAFEACDPEAAARSTRSHRYPASADEVRALRTLFRICADRGLGFSGSW